MSYALAFWRPNRSQCKALNQILASPLRRALGLHRSASGIRTLWEFGIPTINTIRLRCILQAVSRAYRSAADGNALPSILVEDAKSFKPAKTAAYCRPFVQEVAEVQAAHPAAAKLPIAKKQLDSICKAAMVKEWHALSSLKARAIKPELDCPRYISVDSKPLVCIRARLRLASALTPRRRFIYGLTNTDKCECGLVGDTEHVLMKCTKFNADRSVCSTGLLELYSPVKLTLALVLGQPPPLPADRTLHNEKSFLKLWHEQCLQITGVFLLSIDRRSRL
jgi:hypothetical protein